MWSAQSAPSCMRYDDAVPRMQAQLRVRSASGARMCCPAGQTDAALPHGCRSPPLTRPAAPHATASQAGAVEAPDAALDRTLAFLRVVKYTPPTDW